MTIHVYADSFGEIRERFNELGTGKYEGWPLVLSKTRSEDVYITAQGGTGPNWSLEFLISDLEGKDRKYRDRVLKNSIHHQLIDGDVKEYPKLQSQDNIIILLSDQKRMSFPFLDSPSRSDGIFLAAEHDFSLSWQTSNNHLMAYKQYTSSIKTLANTLGPMFLYENVKNITFLHLLSKMFRDYNFLVFTCFGLNHYTSNLESFNIKSTKLLHDLDFKSLNTSNFYYCPTPIAYIVGPEKKEQVVMNHMSVEQNKKFASFCNAILNNEEPDSSWFINYDKPLKTKHDRYADIYGLHYEGEWIDPPTALPTKRLDLRFKDMFIYE